MFEGPNRFSEKNDVSPVENFLTKQIKKEEEGNNIYPSYDSFKHVAERLLSSQNRENLDPEIENVLEKVSDQQQKQKRFKM